MKEFLSWSIGRLNQAGIDFPRMEAEVLFARALKLCREEIYRRPERVLTESEKTNMATSCFSTILLTRVKAASFICSKSGATLGLLSNSNTVFRSKRESK